MLPAGAGLWLLCLPVYGLAEGRVLAVGPDQAYRMPSEAAREARPGDTVIIDAGAYADCAIWRQDNLTLRAREGEVRLAGRVCAGKGIWIVSGRQILIEGITFADASVPDRNGAGIRLEPDASVTVRNSRFLGNEIGLLAGNGKESFVVVENSHFEGTTVSHALYVNFIARLEIRNSVFRRQFGKHHVKSRARESILVSNEIDDGNDGTSSYLVDFPNGGTIWMERNRLTKGPRSSNASTAIAIGLEGEKLASGGMNFVANEFISRRAGLRVFIRNGTGTDARLSGNRPSGFATILAGPGSVSDLTSPVGREKGSRNAQAR